MRPDPAPEDQQVDAAPLTSCVSATRFRRSQVEPQLRTHATDRIELFGDEDGRLGVEALAKAPRTAHEEQELRDTRLLGDLNLI